MDVKCPKCETIVEVFDASVKLALNMGTGVLTACLECGKEFIVFPKVNEEPIIVAFSRGGA